MTKSESRMTNMETKRTFDLQGRTAKFGILVIRFVKQITKDPITIPLISQLIRSATSVGANYCEADNAESKRDFQHKISICKKEAREVQYWLQMMAEANPKIKIEARVLWKEANELLLIFGAILKSVRKSIRH